MCVPRSRRNPQFNWDCLERTLPTVGMSYIHMATLGGLRHPRPDSPNTAWQNENFRGYADYMQTPEFAQALDGLMGMAASERVAIMCAEAVPWRCHRSLIADALTVRGIHVRHIMTANRADDHRLTPFAHVEGTRITYSLQRELPLP